MEEKNTDKPAEKKQSPLERLLNFFYEIGQSFKGFSTINETDHVIMVAFKVILRVIGILILLALSPVLIVSMLLAFLLAG
ncbi:MAG: hypothetical protein AAFP02_15485 [Bacteroidota bacterium]